MRGPPKPPWNAWLKWNFCNKIKEDNNSSELNEGILKSNVNAYGNVKTDLILSLKEIFEFVAKNYTEPHRTYIESLS